MATVLSSSLGGVTNCWFLSTNHWCYDWRPNVMALAVHSLASQLPGSRLIECTCTRRRGARLFPVNVCKGGRCPGSASSSLAVCRRYKGSFGWLAKRKVWCFPYYYFYTQLSLSWGIATHKQISLYISPLWLVSMWSRSRNLGSRLFGLIFPIDLRIGGQTELLLPLYVDVLHPAIILKRRAYRSVLPYRKLKDFQSDVFGAVPSNHCEV